MIGYSILGWVKKKKKKVTKITSNIPKVSL